MEKHNQNNLTVVKHNHLNQASYKLSLDERRLILSSIALINPREPMPDEITVHATDYAYQWDINQKYAYDQLKEARQNLFERSVRLRHADGEIEDMRWIYNAKYKDGEGYIKIKFSPDIKPYLSQLKDHFTSYHLNEIKPLKSGHAIRLYELLMQYKTNGWYDDDLDELKFKFGVKDNYPAWYEFRRWVIDPAVKEINQATNYTIEYKTKKRGRKISRVAFTFALNKQPDMFK